MKKSRWIIGIFSAALFASLVASTVHACPPCPYNPAILADNPQCTPNITLSVAGTCEAMTVTATLPHGHSLEVFIDGHQADSSGSYLFTIPGTYNVMAQAVDKPDRWTWLIWGQASLTVTVEACPAITDTPTPSTETPPPPNYIVTPVCTDIPCAPRTNLVPEKGQCVALQFIAEAGCKYDPIGDRCTIGRPQLRVVCNNSDAIVKSKGIEYQTQPVVGADQPGWTQLDITPDKYDQSWTRFDRPTKGYFFYTCFQPIFVTVDGGQIKLGPGQSRYEATLYVVETAWGVTHDNPNWGLYWRDAAAWANGLVGPGLSDLNELKIPDKPKYG